MGLDKPSYLFRWDVLFHALQENLSRNARFTIRSAYQAGTILTESPHIPTAGLNGKVTATMTTLKRGQLQVWFIRSRVGDGNLSVTRSP